MKEKREKTYMEMADDAISGVLKAPLDEECNRIIDTHLGRDPTALFAVFCKFRVEVQKKWDYSDEEVREAWRDVIEVAELEENAVQRIDGLGAAD